MFGNPTLTSGRLNVQLGELGRMFHFRNMYIVPPSFPFLLVWNNRSRNLTPLEGNIEEDCLNMCQEFTLTSGNLLKIPIPLFGERNLIKMGSASTECGIAGYTPHASHAEIAAGNKKNGKGGKMRK